MESRSASLRPEMPRGLSHRCAGFCSPSHEMSSANSVDSMPVETKHSECQPAETSPCVEDMPSSPLRMNVTPSRSPTASKTTHAVPLGSISFGDVIITEADFDCSRKGRVSPRPNGSLNRWSLHGSTRISHASVQVSRDVEA